VKVDVESHQLQVFARSSAAKFFDRIDVPVIFMEWAPLCQKGSTATAAEVNGLLSFFAKRRYRVFSDDGRRLQGTNCSQWSTDVVFAKQSFEF